jgi:FixJ family two-component response regulator
MTVSDQLVVGTILSDNTLIRRCEEAFERLGIPYRHFSAMEPLGHSADELPHVVFIEMRQCSESELALQERFREAGIPTCFVYFADNLSLPLTVRAVKGGACNILPRSASDSELIHATESALAVFGRREMWLRESLDARQRLTNLSARQRQIMERVVSGETNKAIGLQLHISIKTVEKHRHVIHQRTATRCLSELVGLYIAAGNPLDAAYGFGPQPMADDSDEASETHAAYSWIPAPHAWNPVMRECG